MKEKLDILYYNGRIRTMEASCPSCQAIGVKGGRIAFLGSLEEAGSLEAEERVDLEGKPALPGFVDGHMHLVHYGFLEQSVKLFDCASVGELLGSVKAALAEKKRPWLYARGWNEENFQEKKYPLRSQLDALAPDIPVMATRVCGHVAVCNRTALDLIRKHPLFQGLEGEMDYETGLVKEGAVQLFYLVVESKGTQPIEEAIELAVKDMNKAGITGCQCDDFSSMPGANFRSVISAYRTVAQRGELTVRIYEQCLFERMVEFQEFLDEGYRTGWGDDLFCIGPLKLLLDGSLGARTAALNRPYEGTEEKGQLIFTQEQLDELVSLAHREKMQIAAHCIGDRAMDSLLQAIEKAQERYPRQDCRHGIVHAQIANAQILAEMKEREVIAYIQPVFTASDRFIAEDRIGAARLDKAYAWNSMIKEGILTVGGSDAPVESFNILENIYFAVTRKTKDAQSESWLSKERVTVEDAVKMFTVNPAAARFQERDCGTLAVGKLADFCVLSEDIFAIPEDDIKDVSVLRTVLAGRTVYSQAGTI